MYLGVIHNLRTNKTRKIAFKNMQATMSCIFFCICYNEKIQQPWFSCEEICAEREKKYEITKFNKNWPHKQICYFRSSKISKICNSNGVVDRETKCFRQTSVRRKNPSYEMTKSNLISEKKTWVLEISILDSL